MKIRQFVNLKPYNTFGIAAIAETFIDIDSETTLRTALKKYNDPFVLGGGSNMLLVGETIKQPVFHINIKGINEEQVDAETVLVKAMAGENWHDFVLWCLNKNYGGLENLSLIPGNVGTSPIQNIGAYGVEVKDCISKVTAISLDSGETLEFSNKDCQFSYRDSVFKNELKNKVIITEVQFKLSKHNHKLHLKYGAIQNELNVLGVKSPTIQDVSNAVVNIRKSKLPDPKKLGNSGSFFKNPIIEEKKFSELVKVYPDIPHYTSSKGFVKLAAGWLIEQTGLKGYQKNNVGVHDKQALVLVNLNQAKGIEVWELAQEVKRKVKDKFGIELETEVNIIH